ncbi:MAG TPA: inorganic diphosphatase [Parafilimonas sp.]|nr:inorganic diphosphatase [Parafilimonas sp.]
MKLPPAFVKDTDNIHVIIETPKGSGNKYAFDPKTQLFKLTKILPEGLVFPLHFGFIPCTKGEDGDPLDALVLMDEPSYPGNLIECKVLGIIEAKQTEKNGDSMRNDRLITAAIESQRYGALTSLKNLDKYLVDEIINFFITYNEMGKKKFQPLGNKGPQKATNLIKNHLMK